MFTATKQVRSDDEEPTNGDTPKVDPDIGKAADASKTDDEVVQRCSIRML